MSKPKRKRKSLTLAEDVIKYLAEGIKRGEWYNFSHAVESIIREYMKRESE